MSLRCPQIDFSEGGDNYPDTEGLADARPLRANYLYLLANGIDPQTQAEQATELQQVALDSIFSTVAANWFALKQASVRPDYAKDIWRFLEKDVFPAIGEIPVQEIKARKLVEALEPIKARGAPETYRCLMWIELSPEPKL